jgi:hypothetical protein
MVARVLREGEKPVGRQEGAGMDLWRDYTSGGGLATGFCKSAVVPLEGDSLPTAFFPGN